MSNKHEKHNEEVWKQAKKICRLNVRQVEMARALGMNPKKLPRLRPGPHERWKLPVGEFIEECYSKRFGGNSPSHHVDAQRGTPKPLVALRDVPAHERTSDAQQQADDLISYLMNLADDLEALRTQRSIARVLPAVAGELREIAGALENGESIWPIPECTPPCGRTRRTSCARSAQDALDRMSDDDIPF